MSGSDNFVRVLAADNGEELLSYDQHLAASNSAVFANDGKAIASAQGKKAVELWDAASGEMIRRFEIPEQRQAVPVPIGSPRGSGLTIDLAIDPIVGAFSLDGRLLAVEAGHQVLLFDVATGKPQISLLLVGDDSCGGLPDERAVVAFGGAVLATAYFSDTIILWDLKTGKKIRKLVYQKGAVSALSMSANGQTLASCTGYWGERFSTKLGETHPEEHIVRLWDVATGQPLLTIRGHMDNVRSVVYSPDGWFLISGGEDKTIRMWEVSTGEQLLCWKMSEQVNQVAISPDGKKVAAVLVDGSVTLFPIDPPRQDQPQPPVDDKAINGMWADLAGEDAEQAYRAVRALSADAEDVPAFLAKRLRPARNLSLAIADLDSNDFDRRETASKELIAAGAQAEPTLRKAMEQTDSEEVRSRIARLLKPLGAWVVTDPDLLRALRAIWVLERIGTPEARVVLDDLATGAPEARQTREAKAALDFLDKRAAASKP